MSTRAMLLLLQGGERDGFSCGGLDYGILIQHVSVAAALTHVTLGHAWAL